MAKPGDITIIKTDKGLFARVDNPRWNVGLNRMKNTKGWGHAAVVKALQSHAKNHRIVRVRYQPLNGKWYAEIERL